MKDKYNEAVSKKTISRKNMITQNPMHEGKIEVFFTKKKKNYKK